MQNKALFSAIAVVSVVAIWWLSSNNIHDIALSESEKSDSVSALSKKVEFATTPKVFHSPPADVTPKRDDIMEIKQPIKKSESESWDATAIKTAQEARSDVDNITTDTAQAEEATTPDDSAEPELNNEYDMHQETEFNGDQVEAADAETQNIYQQLQTMRDAGLGETATREAEEKLIQMQRLRDQNSISKTEEISEEASL